MLGVDFSFPSNLCYFRSSIILVVTPSTTHFNYFFNFFNYLRGVCLCLIMVSQRQQKLQMLRCGIPGLEELCKICLTVRNEKNQFFYELLFKCLVSWLIYKKRSMPGRNIHKYLPLFQLLMKQFGTNLRTFKYEEKWKKRERKIGEESWRLLIRLRNCFLG